MFWRFLTFIVRPFAYFDAAIVKILQSCYNVFWDAFGVLTGTFSLAAILLPLGLYDAFLTAQLIGHFSSVGFGRLVLFTIIFPLLVLHIPFGRNEWKVQTARSRLQKAGRYQLINLLALSCQNLVVHRFVYIGVDLVLFYFVPGMFFYFVSLFLSYYVNTIMVRDRDPDRFKLPSMARSAPAAG